MELVRFADAPTYTATGHEEVSARRLQGEPASTAAFAWVGHSVIPSGALIPMDAGAVDKVYVVTEGNLAVLQQDGVRHDLSAKDSIFIPAGEARAVINDSGELAAMIVVTPGLQGSRQGR